jgi:hypothetical protein
VILDIVTKLFYEISVEEILSQNGILTAKRNEKIRTQLEANLKKLLGILVLQCKLAKCTAQKVQIC